MRRPSRMAYEVLRGTGAAADAMSAKAGPVKLVAMADLAQQDVSTA